MRRRWTHKTWTELFEATTDPAERDRQRRVRVAWRSAVLRAQELGGRHARAGIPPIDLHQLAAALKIWPLYRPPDSAEDDSVNRDAFSDEGINMARAAMRAYAEMFPTRYTRPPLPGGVRRKPVHRQRRRRKR